jgi:hypothetical protein
MVELSRGRAIFMSRVKEPDFARRAQDSEEALDIQEREILKRFPDDPRFRGASEASYAMGKYLKLPKPPSTKTIYKALETGTLESRVILGIHHFSLRQLAEWMAHGCPTESKSVEQVAN